MAVFRHRLIYYVVIYLLIMKRAIPVKIIEEKYANKLLSGQIYMRALSKFGMWNKSKDKELDNDYRGDISEGIVKTYKSLSEAQPGIDPGFANIVHSVSMIDDTELKYLRIFCLYGLRWFEPADCFLLPDKRIEQFGDTAVIITDFEEFVKRLLKEVEKLYNGPCLFLIDDVDYFDYGETKELYPGYSKHKSYAWQNEIRIAVAKLEKNNFEIHQKPDEYSMVHDDNDLFLEIGDIRDIAYKVTTKEFLKPNKDDSLKYSIKMGNRTKTIVDNIADETKKQLKNYKTHGPVTLTAII